LGQELGQELEQELGPGLEQGLGQQPGQELAQQLERELGQELGSYYPDSFRQTIRNQHCNFFFECLSCNLEVFSEWRPHGASTAPTQQQSGSSSCLLS
jgi:hypothetical protein